jgi:hypothetical protein
MSAHRLSLELALSSQKISKIILIFSLLKSSGARWCPFLNKLFLNAFPVVRFSRAILRQLDRLPDSFCTFTTLQTRANISDHQDRSSN